MSRSLATAREDLARIFRDDSAGPLVRGFTGLRPVDRQATLGNFAGLRPADCRALLGNYTVHPEVFRNLADLATAAARATWMGEIVETVWTRLQKPKS
ncbi:hypothetical protein A4G99_01260 [Haladaptatus sp. R4]|uniref:hypothetical protein n=1 Tax=Haladaptatus sp. R4 TaxID=1679489 RepID=UPI0007B48D8A|nr:hypothetical protein [Haladaptatus sp. R4]KZN25181.1 hypothetical protein A4G99_01260 [Haladaptatus sp. R4]